MFPIPYYADWYNLNGLDYFSHRFNDNSDYLRSLYSYSFYIQKGDNINNNRLIVSVFQPFLKYPNGIFNDRRVPRNYASYNLFYIDPYYAGQIIRDEPNGPERTISVNIMDWDNKDLKAIRREFLNQLEISKKYELADMRNYTDAYYDNRNWAKQFEQDVNWGAIVTSSFNNNLNFDDVNKRNEEVSQTNYRNAVSNNFSRNSQSFKSVHSENDVSTTKNQSMSNGKVETTQPKVTFSQDYGQVNYGSSPIQTDSSGNIVKTNKQSSSQTPQLSSSSTNTDETEDGCWSGRNEQAQACMVLLTEKWGTGNKRKLSLTFKNKCQERIYAKIEIEKSSKYNSSGANGMPPGTTFSWSANDATGRYDFKYVGSKLAGKDWVCAGKYRDLSGWFNETMRFQTKNSFQLNQ